MPDGLFGWPGQGIPGVTDLYGKVDIQFFTSSGTWRKPAGAIWVTAVAVGPGGGGGGGRKGTTITNRFGGTSGAGGKWGMIDAEAAAFEDRIDVTIGAGGVGAAAQTSDSSNGLSGSGGGETSFGGWLTARSGDSGNGGSDTSGGGSGTTTDAQSLGQSAVVGQGVVSNPLSASSPFTSSGGSGVGVSSAGVVNQALRTSNAATTVSYYMRWLPWPISVGGRGGDGGLVAGTDTSARDGVYGGGGGGGGGGTDGVVNGGAGGSGGNGYVVVRTLIGTPSTINVQSFRTDGTWIKPTSSHLQYARIFLTGAGGGGGAGQRGAAGTTRSGGGGGAGGSAVFYEIPLSLLPDRVDVTVGIGGSGGAAPADNSHGSDGTKGGSSSFGTYVTADGGFGGRGSAVRSGGALTRSTQFSGQDGGSGSLSTTGSNAGLSITTSQFMNAAGGGGGACASDNTNYNGGRSWPNKSYGTKWPDATLGADGVDPLVNFKACYGTGGGAGMGGNSTVNGGRGGHGGSTGGGGGGGGGTTNGSTTSTGAGGNGGNGMVVVLCY